MPVIYNDVPSNTVSHVENLQWGIYWQNLSRRYSVVTYVVAHTLVPKICSGVPIVRTFHAGNLQRLLPVQPLLSEAATTYLTKNYPASPAGKQ